MNQKLLLGALLFTGVGTAAFASGRATSGPNPERAERFITWRVNEALDDLDATDEQRSRILGIKDRVVVDGKEVFKGHAETRTELRAQWAEDKPDAARVHAIIDERADAMRGFAHKFADAVLEVHAILTPEQRTKVSEELASSHQGGCGH